MATRATEGEVKEILQTDITVSQVTPFLKAANLLVTDLLADEEYGDALLREIERWLAAHLVAVRDPRISVKRVGEAEVTYHGRSNLGLNHTPYGQQVLLLDHHGRLAEVAAGKRPFEIKVIG